MIQDNIIICDSCQNVAPLIQDVDVVLTSPFYNTSVKTLVYDPFMGSGTTAVACKKLGLRYIGSEISQNQVDWALKRIEES